MSDIIPIKVSEPFSGGADTAQHLAWIDFKMDGDRTLRLIFADDMPPRFKLSLQQLQGLISDERRKAGQPSLETTYTTTIDKIEFASDDANQVAVIRTRFQSGAIQDTCLEKDHIAPTIEHLKRCLEAFKAHRKH